MWVWYCRGKGEIAWQTSDKSGRLSEVVNESSSLKLECATMSRITVRQTTDPYVDNIQYIAWHEVPLEPDGGLHMITIGLGQPAINFFVCHTLNFLNIFK